MTKITPDEKCETCGGLLVPRELVTHRAIPRDADYGCLRCGRPYRWVGDPPRLRPLVVVQSQDD